MSKYKGGNAMKKLVALLAMMTMLIGCGCSNTSDDQNKDDADNTVTDSQNDQNDTMDNSIGNDADLSLIHIFRAF